MRDYAVNINLDSSPSLLHATNTRKPNGEFGGGLNRLRLLDLRLRRNGKRLLTIENTEIIENDNISTWRAELPAAMELKATRHPLRID